MIIFITILVYTEKEKKAGLPLQLLTYPLCTSLKGNSVRIVEE